MNQPLTTALLAWPCTLSAAGQYSLYVDFRTGELTMETHGNIIHYTIQTTTDIFLEDEALTPTNHTPFVSYLYVNGNPIVQVGTSISTPRQLRETYTAQNLPAGLYSLGNVVPLGVRPCDFFELIETATYTAGLSVPVSNFNLIYLGSCESVPGDTDLDWDIDDADLALSFAHYTGPVGAAGGKSIFFSDTDQDGDVDDADLAISFAGYTGPSAQSVPEPAGLALLGLGGWLIAGRRRV